MRTDHEVRGSAGDHGGRSSVRGAREHGRRRRSMRAGQKKNERMRGGGEWEQEKHGDRISARGACGQKEQEHWLKQIQNTRKTLDTKNNKYIQTLAESNAQVCFK